MKSPDLRGTRGVGDDATCSRHIEFDLSTHNVIILTYFIAIMRGQVEYAGIGMQNEHLKTATCGNGAFEGQ